MKGKRMKSRISRTCTKWIVRFAVGLFPAPCSDLNLTDTGQIWTQLDTGIASCCHVLVWSRSFIYLFHLEWRAVTQLNLNDAWWPLWKEQLCRRAELSRTRWSSYSAPLQNKIWFWLGWIHFFKVFQGKVMRNCYKLVPYFFSESSVGCGALSSLEYFFSTS